MVTFCSVGAGQMPCAAYCGLGTSVMWSWWTHSVTMNGPLPIYVGGILRPAVRVGGRRCRAATGDTTHSAARSGSGAEGLARGGSGRSGRRERCTPTPSAVGHLARVVVVGADDARVDVERRVLGGQRRIENALPRVLELAGGDAAGRRSSGRPAAGGRYRSCRRARRRSFRPRQAAASGSRRSAAAARRAWRTTAASPTSEATAVGIDVVGLALAGS